ncbi:MAG: hypothetical protein ABI895_07625 [Deltaproteobacteria bacterium]
MLKSSRLAWIKWALGASALCAYLACQEEETRPGVAGDCGDECVGGPSPILNPGVGTPATGGSAGASGSGGGTGGSAGTAGSSSMEATLSGSIQALSADLTSDPNVNGTLTVQALGVDLDQVSVDSEPNGAFRLVGVSATRPLWVGVGPFNAAQSSAFVDTLQAVDAPLDLPVGLLALRRSALDEIVASFQVNATGIDSTRGHVILRFIDDQRQGVSGVTLVTPDPLTTSVAYDLGDTYSDQRSETDLRGAMVLLNLPSMAYPGAISTLGVRVGSVPRAVNARIATGAVTLVTTVISR